MMCIAHSERTVNKHSVSGTAIIIMAWYIIHISFMKKGWTDSLQLSHVSVRSLSTRQAEWASFAHLHFRESTQSLPFDQQFSNCSQHENRLQGLLNTAGPHPQGFWISPRWSISNKFLDDAERQRPHSENHCLRLCSWTTGTGISQTLTPTTDQSPVVAPWPRVGIRIKGYPPPGVQILVAWQGWKVQWQSEGQGELRLWGHYGAPFLPSLREVSTVLNWRPLTVTTLQMFFWKFELFINIWKLGEST